MNGLLWS